MWYIVSAVGGGTSPPWRWILWGIRRCGESRTRLLRVYIYIYILYRVYRERSTTSLAIRGFDKNGTGYLSYQPEILGQWLLTVTSCGGCGTAKRANFLIIGNVLVEQFMEVFIVISSFGSRKDVVFYFDLSKDRRGWQDWLYFSIIRLLLQFLFFASSREWEYLCIFTNLFRRLSFSRTI